MKYLNIKCFSIKAFIAKRKNKPKEHKHKGKSIIQYFMRGTNRYIDGKEIQKKVYRVDYVCEECGQTIDYGMERDNEY